MTSEAPLIDYGAPPKWYRRRRFRRIVATVALLVAAPFLLYAGLLVYDRVDGLVRTAYTAHLLRPCLAYTAPPDQVVYSETNGTPDVIVAAPPWVEWWSWQRNFPTLFLHARNDSDPASFSPGERLVAVVLGRDLTDTYDGHDFVAPPRFLFVRPWQVQKGAKSRGMYGSFGSTALVVFPQPADTMRFFAGQPDSEDPSRFSIVVECNGVRQTVAGHVAGNLVTLTPNTGETYEPARWPHTVFWRPAGATGPELRALVDGLPTTRRAATYTPLRMDQ